MKASIKKSSIYKTDNQYYNIEVNGVEIVKLERSEVRQLIGILDNEIN
jgi:hypothetical protein